MGEGMNQTALIDGDILVYRVGFASEDVEEGIAKWRLDELVATSMQEVGCQFHQTFISSNDRSNFRFEIFPDYKANRKDKPKPVHYEMLRKHLLKEYKAEEVSGQEADDALGIALLADPDSILFTIDKDLDQIPGWHYNFVEKRKYVISPISGWRSFYWQCLVGDPTDNITGCPGIGKVKATRGLEGCENEQEMHEVVLRQYLKAYKDPFVAAERLFLAGHLLYIRRKPNDVWHLPNGEVASKGNLKRHLLMLDGSTSTKETPSSTQSPSNEESITLTGK